MVKKIYHFITYGQLNPPSCFAMLKPAEANAEDKVDVPAHVFGSLITENGKMFVKKRKRRKGMVNKDGDRTDYTKIQERKEPDTGGDGKPSGSDGAGCE